MRLKVVNHFRDLGAHVTMDASGCSPTITARLVKATRLVRRLRWLPMELKDKITIIRTTVLPGALYGSEVSSLNQTALAALRTAIADVLGPSSARRCLEVVFEARRGRGAADLDPKVNQLVRKILLLRCVIAKYPRDLTKVRSSLVVYEKQGQKGTGLSLGSAMDCQAPIGPVGHLLRALADHHAYLNSDLMVMQEQEQVIDIQHAPWQTLRPLFEAIAARTRLQEAVRRRHYLAGLTDLDRYCLLQAMKKEGATKMRS